MAVGTRLVLHPARTTLVSRRPEDDITVQPLDDQLFQRGWGGTRNHQVRSEGGRWQVEDLGHGSPIRVNGERCRGTRRLHDGDRVEPAEGLVFTFRQRDDLEPLAAELAHQRDVLSGEPGVLLELLKRGAATRAEAERAVLHFDYRVAHVGTL